MWWVWEVPSSESSGVSPPNADLSLPVCSGQIFSFSQVFWRKPPLVQTHSCSHTYTHMHTHYTHRCAGTPLTIVFTFRHREFLGTAVSTMPVLQSRPTGTEEEMCEGNRKILQIKRDKSWQPQDCDFWEGDGFKLSAFKVNCLTELNGWFYFFPIWFANIMIESFCLDIYATVSVVIDYIHTE